jgi:hypothetical protein
MDRIENEEIETEVEGTDTDTATELDTDSSGAADSQARESGDTDAKVEGAATDEGPKSLAEALTAGIESAKKGVKPEDKAKEGTDEDKPKEKDAAGGEKDKGADDGKKPEGKDGKEPDHVNDPIDARLAPRTQERIRSLADEVKQLREVSENNGQMIGAIMNTGATPQEFGAMVGYLGAVHSDDPAKLEAAYQLLQSELQGLALRMGKPLAEVNWLEGHQDLIDAIRSGATTRELAIEIAMNRASVKRTKEIAAAKAKQTETVQATEKDTQTATAELDALGDELLAADPLYKAKYDAIVPKLKAEFAKIHPRQWKTRFLEEYARAKVGAPKAAPKAAPGAPVVPVNKPKGQPLRPSTPSGTTAKAPGSALDALSSAIDGMRS